MKKKIGEIYNKPIVTGDKNLVTKNEIHESTLKGGVLQIVVVVMWSILKQIGMLLVVIGKKFYLSDMLMTSPQ